MYLNFVLLLPGERFIPLKLVNERFFARWKKVSRDQTFHAKGKHGGLFTNAKR